MHELSWYSSKYELNRHSWSIRHTTRSTKTRKTPHVNSKLDRWPRKQKGTSSMAPQALCIISWPYVHWYYSYNPDTVSLVQNHRYFRPCDPKIERRTLNNNRAPLLCYFKPCASFCNMLWIQIGVSILKNGCKIYFDLCNLDLWPLGLTFYTDNNFVYSNYSWKVYDVTLRGTLYKSSDRRTN